VAISLSAEALTTLEAVAEELGITTPGADDDYLTRLINAASDLIASACNRTFGNADVSDEKHAGYGTTKMFVERYPLLTIAEVSYNDDALDSDDYEIWGDGSAGAIFRVGAYWTWTAAASGDISHDPMPGTERQRYKVSYNGGYVLPKDDGAPDPRTLPWDLEALCSVAETAALRRKS
jgi:hypothetical protein